MPVEQVTESVLATCLAPPAEALHRAHMATRRPPEVHRLGASPSRPRWTVVVPLYRNLDYLRFQVGAFATDRDFRRAELIYVLDSPEQEGELRHYLSGLHQLYGLPIALVVMSANFGYSAACNAGAAVASGRHLLFLNSDVVPEDPGWLAAMTAAFAYSRSVVAVGAKLVFEDQSLQHAGMYFARDAGGHWLNMHYFKGAPRDFAPAQRTRPVPAITGAAMMVDRRRFESVGGFCEDYIIGDYEDSDLCLRLRERGGEIFYAADATLFHFERRSIERHRGYVRGVACLYNRWLAGKRWDQAMTAAMAACSDRATPAPRRRVRAGTE